MRNRTLIVSLAAAAALLPAIATPAIGAAPDKGNFRAHLQAVPHDPAADAGSNARAQAHLTTHGDQLSVRVRAQGLSPKLPHVMHIHGKAQGEAECPGADRRDDLVNDGLIETVEGVDDYGPVLISLTTTGGTTGALTDVLALDRAPVADENGRFTYRRTFQIPTEERQRLAEFHVVIHGHDLDGDGAYGGRITALGAPLEAELPVACGELSGRFIGR